MLTCIADVQKFQQTSDLSCLHGLLEVEISHFFFLDQTLQHVERRLGYEASQWGDQGWFALLQSLLILLLVYLVYFL